MENHCKHLLVTACILLCTNAHAQEAAIRKNLAERLPQFAPVTEVRKTDVPGIYEVKIDQSGVLYTDAQANFVFLGKLIDARTRKNVTDERLGQLNRARFKDLPVADAVTIVHGKGARKIAIFEDPNCSYCKAYEKELANATNVTIHVFYYPVLGPDSLEKSKALWCATDRPKAWQDWMLRNQPSPPAPPDCDTAPIFRNLEFGKRNGVKGTPTNYFSDDKIEPGIIDLKQLEKRLNVVKS